MSAGKKLLRSIIRKYLLCNKVNKIAIHSLFSSAVLQNIIQLGCSLGMISNAWVYSTKIKAKIFVHTRVHARVHVRFCMLARDCLCYPCAVSFCHGTMPSHSERHWFSRSELKAYIFELVRKLFPSIHRLINQLTK